MLWWCASTAAVKDSISDDSVESEVTMSASHADLSDVADVRLTTHVVTSAPAFNVTESTNNASDVSSMTTVSESTDAPLSSSNFTDRQYRSGIAVLFCCNFCRKYSKTF